MDKMRMYRVFWSVLFLLYIGMGCVRADIRMTVDVRNKTVSTVAVVYHTTIVEIPLDGNGHGEHVFSRIGGVHANLFYGMEKCSVFLEDGNDYQVEFDGTDFKRTVTVKSSGGREKIFKYLNEVTLTPVPQEQLALPFGEYAALVEKKEAAAMRILKAWELEEISPRFVRVETGRIRYSYASALMMYAVGHAYMAEDMAYRPDSLYYAAIKARAMEDASLVELKEYREYMKEVARMFGCSREEVKTSYGRTLCMMNYVADHVENDTVRQALLNVMAVEQVEQYGINGIEDMQNLHSTFVTDTVLQAIFREKYNAWDLVRPGLPSPEFRALDVEGNSHTLKEFRGKYLYIDLWASWCAPCRREMPFLARLEEEFKGRNIVFLGLSTDSRTADWVNFLSGQQMTGTQLFLGTGSRFQKAYKADGIPHFILLDPEGRIVNGNMLRPSSPDIREYLNKQPGL